MAHECIVESVVPFDRAPEKFHIATVRVPDCNDRRVLVAVVPFSIAAADEKVLWIERDYVVRRCSCGRDCTKALSGFRKDVLKTGYLKLNTFCEGVLVKKPCCDCFEKYNKGISFQDGDLSPFPTHLCQKTDELNGISCQDRLSDVCAGTVDVTLKMDGSSMTVIFQPNEDPIVCSRNRTLAGDGKERSFLLNMATKNRGDFLVVIQGELVGPKINSNRGGHSELTFFVFNVFVDGKQLDRERMVTCAEEYGYTLVVPKIATLVNPSIADLVDIADRVTYDNGKPAEGIVVRDKFNYKRSFKIINRKYKD